MTNPYTRDYHDQISEGARRSAARILPLVFKLCSPKSIVDVGCGPGAWLRVCRELGVSDILGIDGQTLDTSVLQIPVDRFLPADLASLTPAGLRAQSLLVQRRFDLVLCLEVAEHLPEASAQSFIQTLCSLGPVILFSAALPNQGGTAHINEQLASYWASLFSRQGFVPIDVVRRQVWSDDSVEWWYRQNTLLFALPAAIRARPALATARAQTSDGALDLIHPIQYARAIQWVHDLMQKDRSKSP
jgi:SAM-dependent methyltransferase